MKIANLLRPHKDYSKTDKNCFFIHTQSTQNMKDKIKRKEND